MSSIPVWMQALVSALVVIGAAFALVGSYGLIKLSNFYMRLHGPTKATTLGVGCVLIASSLYFSASQGHLVIHEFLVSLFLFLTAPVGAHLLAKSALHLDQLAEGEASARHRHADAQSREPLNKSRSP